MSTSKIFSVKKGFLLIFVVVGIVLVLTLITGTYILVKPKYKSQSKILRDLKTQALPSNTSSASASKKGFSGISIGPNTVLPPTWPTSLPISSQYLINNPSYIPNQIGGNAKIFSKRSSNDEKTIFLKLLTDNGWKITNNASIGMDSYVLAFERDNLKGSAEIYPVDNNIWLSVNSITIGQ